MLCNLALWDRFLRIIAGIILIIWAVAGGPFWSYIGILPIATGAWGYCPLYAIFKIHTYRPPRE